MHPPLQLWVKHFGNIKRHSVPWWNEECRKAISDCKKAFNRFKRHTTPENVIEFKRYRANSRYVIKKSKKESWRQYVSSITSDTTSSAVWNKIKQLKGSKAPHHTKVLILNGTPQIAVSDIVETFADTFQHSSSFSHSSPEFLEHKKSCEQAFTDAPLVDTGPLNQPITMEDLTYALDNCKNSAPGPDEVPFILLQRLPPQGKTYLL